MAGIKFNPLFTKKFFTAPTAKPTDHVNLPFPIPSSIDSLNEFLNSHGVLFKDGVSQLIDRLKKFASQQKLANDNETYFNRFLANFDYKSELEETNVARFPLWSEGVKVLFGIVTLIESDTVELSRSRAIINDLIPGLAVCAPGSYTNLNNAYYLLISNCDFELYTIRKTICEQLIQQLIEKHPECNFLKGNEIHYVNGVLNYYADQLGFDTVEDDYANLAYHQFTIITNEFKKEITNLLTPDLLCDYLVDQLTIVKRVKAVKNKQSTTKSLGTDIELTLNAYGPDPLFNINLLFDEDALFEDECELSTHYKANLYLTIFNRLSNTGYFDCNPFLTLDKLDKGELRLIKHGSINMASFITGKYAVPLTQYLAESDDPFKLLDILIKKLDFNEGDKLFQTHSGLFLKDKTSFIRLLEIFKKAPPEWFYIILHLPNEQLRNILNDEKMLFSAFDHLTVIERFFLLRAIDHPSIKAIIERHDILPYTAILRNLIRNDDDFHEYKSQFHTESEAYFFNAFSLLLTQDEIPDYYKEPKTIEDVTRYRSNTLINLCESGMNMSGIELLLQNGVDPNYFNDEDKSPITNSILSNNVPLFKLLMEHGAKLDLCDKDGFCPIHVAACCINFLHADEGCSDLLMLKTLLDIDKTMINAASKNGTTPLSIAVNRVNVKSVLFLIERGADVSYVKPNGQTVLDSLITKLISHRAKLFNCDEYLQIYSSLVSAGAVANSIEKIFEDLNKIELEVLLLLKSYFETTHGGTQLRDLITQAKKMDNEILLKKISNYCRLTNLVLYQIQHNQAVLKTKTLSSCNNNNNNDLTFFKPEVRNLTIKKLLHHVASGEKNQAEEMLKKNPLLLFEKETTVDDAGRTLCGTALQIALGAKAVSISDVEDMVEMLERYLLQLPNGKEVIAKQYAEQFPEGFDKLEEERNRVDFTALKNVFAAIKNDNTALLTEAEEAVKAFKIYLENQTKVVIKTGYHFNEALFEEALKLDAMQHHDDFGESKYNKKFAVIELITSIQAYLPAPLAQEVYAGFNKLMKEKNASRFDLQTQKMIYFSNLIARKNDKLLFKRHFASFNGYLGKYKEKAHQFV